MPRLVKKKIQCKQMYRFFVALFTPYAKRKKALWLLVCYKAHTSLFHSLFHVWAFFLVSFSSVEFIAFTLVFLSLVFQSCHRKPFSLNFTTPVRCLYHRTWSNINALARKTQPFPSLCTHNHQFMIIISIYPELFYTEMEMQIEKNNKKNFKTHD